MQIKQWEDTSLAQFSYAVLSDCEQKMVLIDPSRNPQPYLDYANENGATVIGIIETHPHADFISSHAELGDVTGATIYTSSLTEAGYTHTAFDEGGTIVFGKIKLIAIHTPGHSPDSICILLEHDGIQKAIFTGDTLFIGDCGRPDLREGAGKLRGSRRELAKSMYRSLRDKLLPLTDDVTVYPAHGAGTLCGKDVSKANSSTMGHEKQTNWSLQSMTEDEFVTSLLSDQPFIPAYFSYDVELNRQGAAPFKAGVDAVTIGNTIKNASDAEQLDTAAIIIDARNETAFKKGHLPNSVNLMEGAKFETWLGSIIMPEETFYLAGENKEQLQRLIARAAAIGYESKIKEAFIIDHATQSEPTLDVTAFKENTDAYTIVDIRNIAERKESQPFENSILMPLPEIRNRLHELPTDKPIVVHCAGGYRSAAGSSIISSALQGKVKVFDLGEAVKEFE